MAVETWDEPAVAWDDSAVAWDGEFTLAQPIGPSIWTVPKPKRKKAINKEVNKEDELLILALLE